MTLANIDPHVILHQKMHVLFTGIFVGRSIGPPAPCGLGLMKRRVYYHLSSTLSIRDLWMTMLAILQKVTLTMI